MNRIYGLVAVMLLWIVPLSSAQSSAPERIRFETGATSAERFGQVSGFTSDAYVLRAFDGQVMQVSVDNAYLTLVSPSGQRLAWAQAGTRYSSLVLTETGDYHVNISVPAGTPTTNYRLWVSIIGTPQTGQPIERIQFQPGTSGAVVSGQVGVGTVRRYALYALAGQTMDVRLSNANLTVISPTGQILSRASQGTRNLTVVLPETGDYVLEAVAPGVTSNYTLFVTVVWPPDDNNQPTRIQFAAGSSSTQITGQVSRIKRDQYVLYAFAGQQLQVSLSVGYVAVVSPSGQPLAQQYADDQALSVTLPETGDYVLHIGVPLDAPNLTYTMFVSVTGRTDPVESYQAIKFAAGATSATVYGRVGPYETDGYTLYAFAGQQMTLSVSSGYLTVVTPNGRMIINPDERRRNVSFVLPETGDYLVLINVPVGSSPLDYSLFVSII